MRIYGDLISNNPCIPENGIKTSCTMDLALIFSLQYYSIQTYRDESCWSEFPLHVHFFSFLLLRIHWLYSLQKTTNPTRKVILKMTLRLMVKFLFCRFGKIMATKCKFKRTMNAIPLLLDINNTKQVYMPLKSKNQSIITFFSRFSSVSSVCHFLWINGWMD